MMDFISPDIQRFVLLGNCIGFGWLAARSQLAAARARRQWQLAGLSDWDPESNLMTLTAADAELYRMAQLAAMHGAEVSALTIRLDARNPIPAARAIAEGVRVSDAAWRVDHDTVCVLLVTPNQRSAVQAAHRICTIAIEASDSPDVIRAGIAAFPADGEDTWSLSHTAMQRLAPPSRWESVAEMIATAYGVSARAAHPDAQSTQAA